MNWSPRKGPGISVEGSNASVEPGSVMMMMSSVLTFMTEPSSAMIVSASVRGPELPAAALFSLAFQRRSPARWVAILLLCGWTLVLPSIRWNFKKSFYIDCKGIESGMALKEVRNRMAGYRLQGETRGESPHRTELDQAHLLFHPSSDYSSDWCIVYIAGGHVDRIAISSD